jgi:hypothetical protein
MTPYSVEIPLMDSDLTVGSGETKMKVRTNVKNTAITLNSKSITLEFLGKKDGRKTSSALSPEIVLTTTTNKMIGSTRIPTYLHAKARHANTDARISHLKRYRSINRQQKKILKTIKKSWGTSVCAITDRVRKLSETTERKKTLSQAVMLSKNRRANKKVKTTVRIPEKIVITRRVTIIDC